MRRQGLMVGAIGVIILALAGCAQNTTVQKPQADRNKLAEINLELGVQYMQSREFQTAMDKLNKAIELNPRYVDAHNAMGLLRAVLGQNEQAETSFKQALHIDPANASAMNNYGQFLCQRGRYDEGQKLFATAAADPLYQNPEKVLNNAGSCAVSAGKLDVAEDFFRKALEIDHQLTPALLQLAEVNFQRKRFLPARGYLQRYIEVAQHSPKSLWLGIQIERELGDRNAEASYALLLERNFPDAPQTKLLLESKPQ